MRNTVKTLTEVDERTAQFDQMIETVEQYQKKYRGVRGALLKKLHDELMQLKPSGSSPRTLQLAASADDKPSCRACGRAMVDRGDGMLACQNGHTRLAT